MKTLLAITTLNQNSYTKKCLNSLKHSDVDTEIWDDYSQEDDVESLAKEYNVKFYPKSSPQGLTDSWNRIYRRFKESDYDACFISNNDVLIPLEGLGEMIKALKDHPLVVPLSSLKSVSGYNAQSVENYGIRGMNADNPYQVQSIQDKLLELHYSDPYGILPPFPSDTIIKGPHGLIDISKCIGRFHGFFFGFNRDIFSQEYDSLHLFDPTYINVGNEDELSARLTIKPVAVKTAFVFHYKAVTLGSKGNRNLLERYHE